MSNLCMVIKGKPDEVLQNLQNQVKLFGKMTVKEFINTVIYYQSLSK